MNTQTNAERALPLTDESYRHVRMYIREEDAQRLESLVLAMAEQQATERERYMEDRQRYFDISLWATQCPDGVRANTEVVAHMDAAGETLFNHQLLADKFKTWRKDMAGKRGDQRRQRPHTYLTGDVISSLLAATISK